MPFDLATGRTDRTVEPLLHQRDGQPLGSHVPDHEPQTMHSAKAFHHAACRYRRTGDAQVDVQAGHVIALPGEFQHQGQRILAAGKSHQHPV